MQYITHERFEGKDLSGNDIIIRRKKILERRGDILFYNNNPICIYRSLVGKKHFALNDDNKGLERGSITYAIAYSNRINYGKDKTQQRFTDEEINILFNKYPKYLKSGEKSAILFSDSFFEADVSTLREIAKSLNIDVPKERDEE